MIFGIIVGLIVLMVLVALHELGHAIVARRNGVVVEEFAIGFPPKAFSKKPKQSFLGKNVEYRFNWLPLGGYVRMKGEYDSSNKKGDYGAASYWAKTKILFAGVAVNWLVAAVLFTILALVGMPKIIDNQFTIATDTKIAIPEQAQVQIMQVVEGSLAAKAGLQAGDNIIKINDEQITSANQVTQIVQKSQGQKITINFLRSGDALTRDIKLSEDKIGVALGERQARELRYSTWSAPIVGVGTTLQFTGLTFTGLGDMIGKLATGLVEKFSANQDTREQAGQKLNDVAGSVTGPVGILGIIFPQAGQGGLTAILFLTALISLSLAVMNVLPIPALDGGRWLIMTIYKLRKKVLTKEREENIQAVGMMILLGLMLLITFLDIGKLK